MSRRKKADKASAGAHANAKMDAMAEAEDDSKGATETQTPPEAQGEEGGEEDGEEDGGMDLGADLAADPDMADVLDAPRPKDAAVAAAPAVEVPARPPLTEDERIAYLGRVNVFSGLSPVYLRRMAGLVDEASYQEGTFLFREGDVGDKLYLIVDGAVRISRNVPGMGEEALAVLRAGDYFGEMALIDDFPRSADAFAHEATRVLVIGKQKLEDLLFVDRDLAYDLLWNFVRTLSGRLRQTNDKMTFLAVTSKF